MTNYDIDMFSEGFDYQAIALKEHIASGAKNIWAVSWKNEGGTYSRQFNDFDEAYECYRSKQQSIEAQMCLYTRVGTAVMFMWFDNSESDNHEPE